MGAVIDSVKWLEAVLLTSPMSVVVTVAIDLTGEFDWSAFDLTGEAPLAASISVVVVMT